MVLGVLCGALCVRVSITCGECFQCTRSTVLGVLGVALCVSGCSGYLQSAWGVLLYFYVHQGFSLSLVF